MPTIPDFDTELQAAVQAGLRGDLAAAIAGVERCRAARPDRVEPLVQLLDLYPRAGRLDEADRVAGEVLALAPDDASVRLAVARLHEGRGRPAEALDALRSPHVNTSVSGKAYPVYLRLLVEAERWDEAVIESSWALKQPSLWRPDATVARALSLLHFGDDTQAEQVLAGLDLEEYRELVDRWVERLGRAGALPAVRALLASASARSPGNPRLAAFRARFE